ncbi:hypothetical protein CYMTET_36180 [Cymbomonas tetramitiformis]|uniref:Uncharacterized protein n=1 Tax=Cymbomonas tetramitiformis TaxID=36881 RepID=A0AAE0CGF8_9CHLO|nr:hypothetical protein CYMTET_36180 [Cymbomonas tetramitiformis]
MLHVWSTSSRAHLLEICIRAIPESRELPKFGKEDARRALLCVVFDDAWRGAAADTAVPEGAVEPMALAACGGALPPKPVVPPRSLITATADTGDSYSHGPPTEEFPDVVAPMVTANYTRTSPTTTPTSTMGRVHCIRPLRVHASAARPWRG